MVNLLYLKPENPAPVIIEEVSPNFPVVLPDGTPTLSDRASGAQEVTFSWKYPIYIGVFH